MTRRGLRPDRVVDAAVELIGRDPAQPLTLKAIAAHLGVRTPSLYSHVAGLDDLRHRVALRALGQLRDVLLQAVAGRSGDDAVRAVGHAIRRFAIAQPGLYAHVIPEAGVEGERAAAAHAAAEPALASLRDRGLNETDAVHAARSLRSAVHGFVALELAGGFQLAVSVDDSFEALLDSLCRGLPAG